MDKRKRSSSAGGGGGKLTGVLAALLGNGGEASPNQEVDLPEFDDESNYLDPKGRLTSKPFSSNYNFWDKIGGKQDKAASLNADVVLNQITLEQSLNNLLKQTRGLIPIQEESEIRLGAVKRDNLLKERQTIDPLDVNKTYQNTWASKGIAPTDLSGLSAATAKRTLGDIGIANTGNDILTSVLTNPQNRSLLEAGILAKEAQPIATLRRGLETNLGPNEFMQRDGLGVSSIDKLLNPGIGYGSKDSVVNTTKKVGGLEYPITEKVTTPGSFRGVVPIDPNKKAAVMGSGVPSAVNFGIPNDVPSGLNPAPAPAAPDQGDVIDNLLKQIKLNSKGDPMLDLQRILNANELDKLRKSGILDRLKGL